MAGERSKKAQACLIMKHNVQSVTPEMIAYAACQVRTFFAVLLLYWLIWHSSASFWATRPSGRLRTAISVTQGSSRRSWITSRTSKKSIQRILWSGGMSWVLPSRIFFSLTHRPVDRQLVDKVRKTLPTAHDDKTEKEPDPSSSKARILKASLERTKKRRLLETRTTDVPSDETVAVSSSSASASANSSAWFQLH